jgi:ABC-type multidrug transport system fused ATPase/permease subunit
VRVFGRTESIFLQALNLLQRVDKLKLGLICMAQILSGLLDLAGVVMIGALCALSIQGIESRQPGKQTSKVLNLLHIQNCDFHLQIIILGSLSISLLLLKTLFAIVFTRKTFKFLSIKGAEISGDLISKILSKDLLFIKKRTSQEILFIISDGIRNLTSGVLATSVTMVADVSMLLILSVGLYVIDPIIAISTTALFIFIATVLYRLLHLRAEQIGIQVEKLIVQSNQKIIEVLSTYRESVVHGRRQFYARQITSLRRQYGEISAELMFQPYIGKYVIELFAIFAAFGLAGFEFASKNAVHAISILSIFLAASTRIAPAILRIQQGLLMIKTSSGTGRNTLMLVRELTNTRLVELIPDRDFGTHEGFSPTILLENLSFSYPEKEGFLVGPISMEGQAGESIAIVGPSGAGKTTLVDLILGVLVPQEGLLEISR